MFFAATPAALSDDAVQLIISGNKLQYFVSNSASFFDIVDVVTGTWAFYLRTYVSPYVHFCLHFISVLENSNVHTLRKMYKPSGEKYKAFHKRGMWYAFFVNAYSN